MQLYCFSYKKVVVVHRRNLICELVVKSFEQLIYEICLLIAMDYRILLLIALFQLTSAISLERLAISGGSKRNSTEPIENFAEVAKREARLVLPQQDNDGSSLKWLQTKLENKLATLFGGFSQLEGQGGWHSAATNKTYHEPVWYYDLAVDDTIETNRQLTSLASWLKVEAKQEAIYLRYPNGRVAYI